VITTQEETTIRITVRTVLRTTIRIPAATAAARIHLRTTTADFRIYDNDRKGCPGTRGSLFAYIIDKKRQAGMRCMWNLISVEELKEMLREQKKFTLVDLRDEADYKAGHIPQAVNISSEELEMIMRRKKNRQPEPVYSESEKQEPALPELRQVLICYRGPESIRTARRLSAIGCEVSAVCGGMEAWRQSFGETAG
jgi:rhodanese-related sulfurtransferase